MHMTEGLAPCYVLDPAKSRFQVRDRYRPALGFRP
jgi:hypothetical protein